MKVTIELDGNEVREAILEYLKVHRADFISQEVPDPPAISFRWNQEAPGASKLLATVTQEFPVHHSDHPYR